MNIALIVLNQASVRSAQQVKVNLTNAQIYGLVHRTEGVDIGFESFSSTIQDLFQARVAIVGFCAAGILIRAIAPLLSDKWQEPPVLAVAEDGSAVVPLVGGLQGANDLARTIAAIFQTQAAITTAGELRFQTTLLKPPTGYELVNRDEAKTFIADLLAGASVKLVGEAPWLTTSQINFVEPSQPSDLVIEVIASDASVNDFGPRPNRLLYRQTHQEQKPGKLWIVGTGPGSSDWLTPQAKSALLTATDWVGYKTYLNLVEPLRHPGITRHESDNRVELQRAEQALDLAAAGKVVAVISSGDPGIFAMAAALFEVIEQQAKPTWQEIEIEVCPGISAFQGAAARFGAPMGHDFCVISLSDILKPWETIAQRITAAAQADLVIAFYNPVSSQRTWQIEEAKQILLGYRDGSTPVMLGKNLSRPGETTTITTLAGLDPKAVDMRTLVIVGSSQSRVIQHNEREWVYTSRAYPRKTS